MRSARTSCAARRSKPRASTRASQPPSALGAGLSLDRLALPGRLHALQTMKADYVTDCLMAFDESILFLHDKVLDHERLVKRLADMQKRKAVLPRGKSSRFDEAIELSDEEEDGSAPAANSRRWPSSCGR